MRWNSLVVTLVSALCLTGCFDKQTKESNWFLKDETQVWIHSTDHTATLALRCRNEGGVQTLLAFDGKATDGPLATTPAFVKVDDASPREEKWNMGTGGGGPPTTTSHWLFDSLKNASKLSIEFPERSLSVLFDVSGSEPSYSKLRSKCMPAKPS
jgi:hypothetical protein